MLIVPYLEIMNLVYDKNMKIKKIILTFFSDFGLEYLISFAKKTNFPWLMSNVYLRNTIVPLGEGKITHIIEKHGIKVIKK